MSRKGGFTLMEALISIVLLTMTLVCYTFMIHTAARYNMAAVERRRQMEAAALSLETGDAVTTNETLTITVTGGSADTVKIAVTRFTRTQGDVTLSLFEVRP